MSFINKKEEVINLVLTRHGKRSLMKGNFDPIYYRFFDDGVTYDSNWAGFFEKQNESEERIKEAPILKPQSSHVGVETAFERHYEDSNTSDNSIDRFYQPLEEMQDEEEEAKCLKSPLFTSRLGSEDSARFQVFSLNQPFSGSLSYRTKFGENIPTSGVKFRSFTTVSPPAAQTPIESSEAEILFNETFADPQSMLFTDGTSYSFSQDYSVFAAQESNILGRGGFELEIYEEVSGSLVKYYFEHPEGFRVVDKYFEILVDQDAEDIAENKIEEDVSSIFANFGNLANIAVLTANDTVRVASLSNIYNELPSDDDVEDCE